MFCARRLSCWVICSLLSVLALPAMGQSPESTFQAGVKALDGRRNAEAVGHFQTACEAGHLGACSRWAYVLYNGNAFGMRSDATKAKLLYRKACDGGEMASCTMLGIATVQGRGGAIGDAAAARPIFQKACEGGHMAGCANLAGMLWSADGGPQDRTRAVSYARKACAGESRFGCDLLKRWQVSPQ